MADPNKIKNDITSLKKKIGKELAALCDMCGELAREINRRYTTEVQNNSPVGELGDFYMLTGAVKRNSLAARSAHIIISRMPDLRAFNISEEMVDEEELKEIFED